MDVSHHLITKLLGKETHRLADLEAAQENQQADAASGGAPVG